MFRSFVVERTLEGSCIYLGMITYSNWVGLIVDLGPVPKVLAPKCWINWVFGPVPLLR
jgi:hypothetical protein